MSVIRRKLNNIDLCGDLHLTNFGLKSKYFYHYNSKLAAAPGLYA